jgi:NitT/TauT family transport system permease protein
MKRFGTALLFFVVLLVGWHYVALSGRWSPLVLPPPEDIVRYLSGAARDGSLWEAFVVTMRRLGMGYAIGILAGMPLGFLTARFDWARDTIGVIGLGLQGLPSVCWVPLSLIWFGQNEAAMLFVVVMGTVWSVALATDNGVRSVPPIYLRAARTMGSRGLHTWVKVILQTGMGVCLALFDGSRNLRDHCDRIRFRPVAALRPGFECDGSGHWDYAGDCGDRVARG